MVGQLIRLKLRIIWNTVRRQTAVLVLAILGTLQFGTMYVGALVGTAFLAQSEGAATLAAVLPIVGPVVFLLWLILPILFSAMDNSLDPVRLACAASIRSRGWASGCAALRWLRVRCATGS